MSEQENMRVVQEMFAALERSDIAGVLDRLSDDIEWRVAGPSELPYAGIHRGRDEVAKFFQSFGQAAEFEVFEPREYLAGGQGRGPWPLAPADKGDRPARRDRIGDGLRPGRRPDQEVP